MQTFVRNFIIKGGVSLPSKDNIDSNNKKFLRPYEIMESYTYNNSVALLLNQKKVLKTINNDKKYESLLTNKNDVLKKNIKNNVFKSSMNILSPTPRNQNYFNRNLQRIDRNKDSIAAIIGENYPRDNKDIPIKLSDKPLDKTKSKSLFKVFLGRK